MKFKLESTRAGGKIRYRASWWEGRKHRSRTFESEEERQEWVKARRDEEKERRGVQRTARRSGDYVVKFSKLETEVQAALLGAWECIRASGGGSKEVREAAEAMADGLGGGVTVAEAVDAHVEEVRRTRRPGTAKDRAWQLKPLREMWGRRKLGELSRGACRDWISQGNTASARAHRHGALSALLRDCVRREWLRQNPMEGFSKPAEGKREEVEIFPAEVAERLLRTAEEKEPGMVPYYAIGLFAGLRPQRELRELAGRDIDLEGGEIYVRWGSTKTGQSRSVPVSPNLRAWLDCYPVKGRVGWNLYAHKRVLEAAGVKWSQDVMRHTRASYRLAETRDAVRTADEMGHNVATLKRHYANRRIPEAEVERFWGILPKQGEGK